ncbi:1-phosphatidylinositol-3-phosphate 5-kinase FAB1B-like isoform X2 [Hevea brasiliensis]|uniref:1-phosphatidylinositol-3-phosphate 5-kinase FAB1B-like isoform X2 n=1 Tax=Hevea brasiliensis TaxID=3981 RepID=UPI002600799F|nr:1-phosphatidylinositol-3-phosphate 5-kinase FAB1B-like isoform X2 [Hevea brasiliensis]
MNSPDKTFSELVGILKSWMPWRSESATVSRDFWMPDQSCRVCYECDSQFTIINRRHHCRLCGRIFCAKCTANSVPAPSSDPKSPQEEWEKIRVCNYCFKQWQQGIATLDNGIQVPSLDLSSSPSAASLASSKSSGTINSSTFTLGSMPYSVGPYQRAQQIAVPSPHQTSEMETNSSDKQRELAFGRSNGIVSDMGYHSPNLYAFSMNSDDDDDDYGVFRTDSETRHFPQDTEYFHQVEFDDMSNDEGSHKARLDGENIDSKSLSSSPLNHTFGSHSLEGMPQHGKKDGLDMDDECEVPSSMYPGENSDAEPVDFENNGLLWLPPEPEDEEDEREAGLFDDDEDDDDGHAAGEWGRLRTSNSFGSGEFRNRDKTGEEQKKAMKNVVDGHFRALVAQLLQVENIPVGDEDDKESWLEIITSLSWEAATLLKPDMSKSGGMDPGGYVKVKCIASGCRCESMVVKGVVCKKNVAHRRMKSKIERPRLLILGGALEYQRVSNHLSSFDTLLQQEMDHLKMAVARIDAHQPDVLLVEKSVSRFAQEYLLAKDISLVLNIKRPLLERIARCTGAQIVPSIDHLSSPKLGYCDMFHVEKFLEDLGTAGQGGKKLVKRLMYFEDCPKPLGFTILLRGANGDELKKVKHVVQYGVFAAYHLALETSFLADEGASLPELPLNSPITVALPDKPSSVDRSISTVPGFTIPANEKPQGLHASSEPQTSNSIHIAYIDSTVSSSSADQVERKPLADGPSSQSTALPSSGINSAAFLSTVPYTMKVVSDSYCTFEQKNKMQPGGSLVAEIIPVNNKVAAMGDHLTVNGFEHSEGIMENHSPNDLGEMVPTLSHSSEVSSARQDNKSNLEEPGPLKEEFPPSPSDHQSILVSLSSRCVWKGTVCERSHLFRIKYYGSFDKPLGRFLRDHLFNNSYICRSCEMPSEAHVHCYTHRQGTLTISVKKLPEIILPGEKDGKIWMWHRCLRCPRTNGFPPATRRVVMSDAAWGLSFGKFLELSFSNHAAASRVASCGHSLHRDCLRFYGFGNMVACFRYASIHVLSVYLPPSKLDFNFENQEWIQKETVEVVDRAELLFSEVLNALSQIAEKRSSAAPPNSGTKLPESRRQIGELEAMLEKEKVEFEELLQKALNREAKKVQPVIDILEINRLRRQLLFQSYMWDHRLIYAASLDNNSFHDNLNWSSSGHEEKPIANTEQLNEMNVNAKPGKGFSSCNSLPVDTLLLKIPDRQGGLGSNPDHSDTAHEKDKSQGSNLGKEDHTKLSAVIPICDQPSSLEYSGNVRRTVSEGQVPIMSNLSDTLDAAWTGENLLGVGISKDDISVLSDSAVADLSTTSTVLEGLDLYNRVEDQNGPKVSCSPSPALSVKGSDNMEDSVSYLRMPFLNFYRSLNKNFLASSEKLNIMGEYSPIYVSSFRELELQGGARLLLPVGVNDTVIPVYDDEPTSIISYALLSPEYHGQLTDDGDLNSSLSLSEPMTSQSFHTVDEVTIDSHRCLGSTDESILPMPGSRSPLLLDPLFHAKAMHARVSFGDEGPLGKVKHSVTCYYAKRFEALRRVCCPSELDFIRSLSRCKKWGAQGGKSNVFFAKTLDDRFIIKQVTKTELESFIKFAPEYFKYLSKSISSRSPTCLAKILGIYQVTSKHLKGGKESKMDVLVMENLLFGRNVTRLYDLKGSSRSRYNPDSSGSNKVLLDQNLIEAMPTSPIFVGNKAKRLLERAVWNDTSFLGSIDVMDYSLLVGLDEEKGELVLGIIDFMRQYTWDKHLETWVKASGILGGPKNSSPTVISPEQYKKRFRKAMTTYFLMVPDQWSPPTIIPSKSQSDLFEENSQGGNSVE